MPRKTHRQGEVRKVAKSGSSQRSQAPPRYKLHRTSFSQVISPIRIVKIDVERLKRELEAEREQERREAQAQKARAKSQAQELTAPGGAQRFLSVDHFARWLGFRRGWFYKNRERLLKEGLPVQVFGNRGYRIDVVSPRFTAWLRKSDVKPKGYRAGTAKS